MSATMLLAHTSTAHTAFTQRTARPARQQPLAYAALPRSSYLTGSPLLASCRLSAVSVQRPRRVRQNKKHVTYILKAQHSAHAALCSINIGMTARCCAASHHLRAVRAGPS